MITSQLISDIVSNTIQGTELFIVEVSVNPGNKILVLIDSMKGALIDDCVKLSRSIEQRLDRDLEDFELEVSSPGLTNPFRVIQQYLKNKGKDVEVVLKTGQKFTGKLISVQNDIFCIETKQKVKKEGKKKPELVTEQLNFTFNGVKTTKIVINF